MTLSSARDGWGRVGDWKNQNANAWTIGVQVYGIY